MNYERGYGHWIVFVIGAILVLMMIGFFKANNQQTLSNVTYKAILRLPCGITVQEPKKGDKVSFPVTVKGYVNGCGWDIKNSIAGTAQVFDGNGAPMTNQIPLNVPTDSKKKPYYFEGTLVLKVAPQTEKGSIIIRGVSNFTHAIEIDF
ncbi:MAG: hypothetical protein KBC17_02840 [Candidatus Pacebacteria bacterium]|nr:hypothetical protein [Candidatus Paceibacterota bacterium]